jgi:hypothetical protein
MESKKIRCRVCDKVCTTVIRIHPVYEFGIDCCSEECADEAEANIEAEARMEQALHQGWLEMYGDQDA